MSLEGEEDVDVKNASPEDIAWLSSLSHSELDMLISLKQLAIQRAKVIGHESMGGKFDLKILRALGGILMEYVKERLKGVSSLAEAAPLLNGCNLTASNLKEGFFDAAAVEEITTSTGTCTKQKRTCERSSGEEDHESKKQVVGTSSDHLNLPV